MLGWLFPRRRARRQQVDDCIDAIMGEVAFSGQSLTLLQAAFRLQGRARDGGVFIGLDQARRRLRRRDHAGLFIR